MFPLIDITNGMNYRELKTKKAWKCVTPEKDGTAVFNDGFYTDERTGVEFFKTQKDFEREFYPSGHKINSPVYYPDIYREERKEIFDENSNPTGKFSTRIYKESVPRYSFAFQQVILVKRLTHVGGNDIQCEFAVENPTEEQQRSYNRLRGGWLTKDMDVRMYEAYQSVFATADTAIVFYLDNGSLIAKTLSYSDGYTLYPHYNRSGKLECFAFSYFAYDETGNAVAEYLEVYDDTYRTVLKQNVGKNKTFKERIKDVFKIDGYTLVEQTLHYFNEVPVAYKRNEEGPCWSASQSSIEGYEISFSQMAHSNQAFAFPILTLQGEGIEAQNDLNGTVKMFTMDSDSKAGYLQPGSASESFMKQLDTLERLIYELSFAVKPPELRSGDLPAAALKILYSPAYEKAISDANFFQDFLNDVARLFTYGYGIEIKDTIGLDNLEVKWWIKPYVHVNWTTTISDLAMAIQNGFISKETASERIQEYATVGEWDKILKEQKKQRQEQLKEEFERAQMTQKLQKTAEPQDKKEPTQ